MKYTCLFLIIILFTNCKFENRTHPEGWEMHVIMTKYRWYLDANMDNFSAQTIESIIECTEKDLGVDFSAIAINAPKIKIKYVYGSFLNKTKASFILKADNGENFTAHELLLKINKETSKNLGMWSDYTIFQGMELIGHEEDIPVYEIIQRSPT